MYTAGSRKDRRGVDIPEYNTKRKLSLRKRPFFVIEKHIEDVKQDQKTVPDLVESIIRPTDPVFEVREVASSMGFAGERPDGWHKGRRKTTSEAQGWVLSKASA